jgi:hypothetical protein
MTLARFGPFFELATADASDSGHWHSLSELFEPGLLAERVEYARAMIEARSPAREPVTDVRAVASTMALGLFARLLSPVIGAVLVGEPAMRPDPTTTWLRTVTSGPVPLRTSEPLVAASPDEAVEHLVLPLASAVSRQFRLSMRILLGNTAAAVVGACHVVSLVEAGLAAEASALRERMLSTPPLRDTGTASGPFVRTSCCLIYRLPMDYICSNCILVSRHTPTAQRIAEGITPARRMSAQRENIDFGQPPFR